MSTDTPTLTALIPIANGSLRWVSDTQPGIRRVPKGDSFDYLDPTGRKLRKAAELQRIKSLAIPPAYVDVWICPLPDGHLQATGRDARGRKQYRYHAEWQAQRGQTKFDSLRQFGQVLPRIRTRVQRQLAGGDTLTRQRVLATLVRLLDTTWLRIGNDAYARENGSYGLTTLRTRHAKLQGEALRLSFVGKSGVRHDLALADRRVSRIVRRCRELPGQELFQYLDEDGGAHRIGSSDVNGWLAEAAQADDVHISAKDFRTWHGSVLALQLLLAYSFDPDAGTRRTALVEVIAAVAQRLGNTPAVCRKAYIHPAVLELGASLSDLESLAALKAHRWVETPPAARGLSLAERQLMGLLAQRNSRKPRAPRSASRPARATG